ncbi:MAG TPA: bifunctional glycosyltransferase/class I SAM-dependent methyltransferase [Actinomycetota bacterium]|nr:bifunctional glycosyltransferase/class I SAM-dependent methyltransferase [Actinomycetota bacterium]
MPRVVITMPAYRAEGTLEKTVADIPPGVADELILVDDASPDNTVQLAHELGIRVFGHPHNRGYGGNQKTCYTQALADAADIVVLLHPDYQYDPKAVPLLIAPILAGHADMTFGSRFASAGNPLAGGMPVYRYIGNRLTTIAENLLLGSRFTEMHSGLRAYTRQCLLSLPFLRYSDDFVFDSQLLVDAITSGQRVVEVPILTRYTKESSSIGILRSLRYVTLSQLHAARRAMERGRRGHRWPVTLSPPKRARIRGGTGSSVEQRCVLCGANDQVVLYPANASGEVRSSEFACTSEAVARHDDILQCRRCGMVSSRPQLLPQQIAEHYAQVVDEPYLAEEGGRRELFRWVLGAMAGYPVHTRRLLEVGSHLGLFLDVARAAGWQARGIEPSNWAVEFGRERFRVDLRQGTVEDLDDPPGSADAIVMLDVLEHLVDPLDALRRLRPRLDDQGILAVSTVNLNSLHGRLRGGNWPWFIRPHLHYFTPETLQAMLHLAGYRMVEWSIVPRSFHLSYIANRGGTNLGALGKAMRQVSRFADPRIPVGWLGDIVFVVARPGVMARPAPVARAAAGQARVPTRATSPGPGRSR